MSETLAPLLADGVIDEVLGRLKSGKEADVWLVRHAGQVLCAKVYKDRHVRSFKNNSGYKEGRIVRNTRTQRAIERGSKFGRASEEDAWKSAESDALYRLHAEGVRVPAPVLFYEGVLLMELVLDAAGEPAPRLIDISLEPEHAAAVYADLRAQAVKMLCSDLIHGDLSAYNVLLAAAGPTVIDFPQVIGASANSQAEFFFKRDIDSVRTHLGSFDPVLLARASDADEIWRAYVRRDLAADFVPTGRAQVAAPRPQGGHGAHAHGGHKQGASHQKAPGHERQEGAARQGRPPQGKSQPEKSQHGKAQHAHPSPQSRAQQGPPATAASAPAPHKHRQNRPQQHRPQQGAPPHQRPPRAPQPPAPPSTQQQQRPAHQPRPPGAPAQHRPQQGRPQQHRPHQGPQRPAQASPARHQGPPPQKPKPQGPVVERVHRPHHPHPQSPSGHMRQPNHRGPKP